MNMDTFCQKIDTAYARQPSLGLTEKFVDAWHSAMGMRLDEMRDDPDVVDALLSVVETPTHPNERRAMAACFLTEIVEINADDLTVKKVSSAIQKMGTDTKALTQTARSYQNRVEAYGLR